MFPVSHRELHKLIHLARYRTGISVALKKLFQFLHQTTQALAEIPRAEAALRLYLQCAQAASDCNLEPVTYEFMERAYEIIEESIPGAWNGARQSTVRNIS